MPEEEMGGDLQTQLDELRARLDELENAVYGPEEEGAEGPGPGRMKAGPGLAILLEGKKGK